MSMECAIQAEKDDDHYYFDGLTACRTCGHSVCPYHYIKCTDCDKLVCDDCRKNGLKQCDGCLEEICIEHFRQCPRCNASFCNDRCINEECIKCGKSFCDECVNDINNDTVCKTCVPYDD